MSKTNNKALFTIFLIVFIDLLGFGIIIPLLPYFAETFHANPTQIGLLVASYSLFQFIAAPILGRLSDRYGRKRILVISQIGSAIGFLILGLADSLPLLFLARVIDGITGGNISVAQAYMADITNKKNRAKGMGLLGAAFGLGFMFGPAIGGILSTYSFSTPSFFAAAIALLAAVSSSLFLTETVNIKKTTKSPKVRLSLKSIQSLLHTQPIGILIISLFVISIGMSGIQATYAIWTERTFSWGPRQVGYMFALIGLTSIITQLLILPRAIKKFGERKTLIYAVPSIAIGLLWFLLPPSPTLLIPAHIFLALGNGLTNPTLQAIASESVSKNEYGQTLGILHSAASLGRIIGPILGGYLFATVGKNAPFLTSGILVLTISFILKKKLRPTSFLEKLTNTLKP